MLAAFYVLNMNDDFDILAGIGGHFLDDRAALVEPDFAGNELRNVDRLIGEHVDRAR